MIDFLNPSDLGPRPRPFSLATKAGGFVFVSGHSAPNDPANGKPHGETPQEQVRGAIETMQTILDTLHEEFGGATAWLREQGWGDGDIERLRHRLTT